MEEKYKTMGIAAVAVAAVVFTSTYVYSTIIKDSNVNASEKVSVNTVKVTPTLGHKYKDGKFDASANYVSKPGDEEMTLSLTLSNDVVTDAKTVFSGTNAISIKIYTGFESGLKTAVVGKKLDDVAKIDKIAGASDTTKGFLDGVAKVQAQARL